MNFGEVITRSWNIIWKHKILWLFGFFASLGAGGNHGGGSNFNFNYSGDFSNPNTRNFPAWLDRLLENTVIWLPIVLILAFLLIALMVILNTFGKIGLARGAWLADQQPVDGPAIRLTFSQLLEAGKRHFWRILLLILLLWALTITLALIILIPTIGLTVITFGIGLICLLPLLCLMFVIFWALTVLADLSVIGIVNEDRTVTDAVKQAWEMLKSRPVDIIVMAVILWIASLVISFIVGLPVLLIMTPVLFDVFIQSETMMRGSILFTIVLFLLYLPVLLFVQSIVQSYVTTAWTLVYRRINSLQAGSTGPAVIDVMSQPTL
jgi:hypothetical protein